jgi:hypothetical protein
MKSIVKKIATALLIVPVLALSGSLFNVVPAYAQADCNNTNQGLNVIKGNCAQGNGQSNDLFGSGGVVTTVINVLLFIVGILCVIMIIFGGIRYTTSAGNKTAVDGAKNTIIYAVVGLIVAIVAYALVNWVFKSVSNQ